MNTTISPYFWNDLLDKIEAGRVIPVLGPDLSTFVSDDGSCKPLAAHVADILAGELGYDVVSNERPVSHQRLFNVVANNHLRPASGDQYSMIHRILKDCDSSTMIVPPALSSLASVTNFKLFITLGFDNLLPRAIDATRGLSMGETRHLAYAPNQHRVDLPCPLHELSAPLVYALFGKSVPAPEFVIHEEGLLEWINSLQNRDNRPPLLFDALRTHHLLFIGCNNLSDWLLRFLIRLTRSNRICYSPANESLIGPLSEPAPFIAFRNCFSPHTMILDTQPEDFINELTKRWCAKQSKPTLDSGHGASIPPDIKHGGVFLSYANEDIGSAETLYQTMRDHEIDTWFDKDRLTSGDRYTEIIRRNIKSSGVILPVFSTNVLNRLHSWRDNDGCHPNKKPYFLREWELALARNELEPGSLTIMPLRIDSCDLTDDMIPRALQELTCDSAHKGQADARFFTNLKQSVRKKRAASSKVL